MQYPITLDKERTLKYGMRALDLAEKKTGIPIVGINLNNLTMNQIATLVWCGLTHEDKNLTVGNVMDLIDEYSNLKEVLSIVGKVLNEAFGGESEESENDEEKN
jgi:hypothetical protein